MYVYVLKWHGTACSSCMSFFFFFFEVNTRIKHQGHGEVMGEPLLGLKRGLILYVLLIYYSLLSRLRMTRSAARTRYLDPAEGE